MKLFYTFLLILVTFFAVGADQPVDESGESSNTLITILGTVITLVVTVLGGYLKSKWSADTKKSKLDYDKSLMEQKNFLIDNRVIPFVASTVEHWLLTQLMPIVKDISDGGDFDWDKHFDNLKEYAKTRVVQKFSSENVDILEHLGENELNNIIDRIVVKAISNIPDNFRGMIPDSIKDKISDKASSFLLKKGKNLLGIE